MELNQCCIGLVNPKSPINVGAVMRAAGCFDAAAVFYTGERFPRAQKFHADTQQVSAHVPLQGVTDLLAAVPAGATLVCVELVEGATPLYEFEHPADGFYIFGPEDGSLDQGLINRADDVVYVPTHGCLNLAATVNILLYDRAAKQATTKTDKSLILASRDTNNRLKVPG